jgi:hypothetical protein
VKPTSAQKALGGRVLPFDAHPLQPDDPPVIGGHRLTGRLSSDGTNVVYLARDGAGGLVVLTTTTAQRGDEAQVRRRLRAEAACARRLPPQCTVRLLADGSDQSPPFLVSEYLEGPTLEQFVNDVGPLSSEQITALAAGLADALASVHDAGLVHRDLRPATIMLAADGPRIIGFGMAQQTAHSEPSSDIGAATYTPGFTAPERRDGGLADRRSDVFAWGCLVGYAANGHSPIAAEDHRYPTRSSDLSAVPEPLRTLVAGALAPDPAARPTARELAARLRSPGIRAATHPSEDVTEVLPPGSAIGPSAGAETGSGWKQEPPRRQAGGHGAVAAMPAAELGGRRRAPAIEPGSGPVPGTVSPAATGPIPASAGPVTGSIPDATDRPGYDAGPISANAEPPTGPLPAAGGPAAPGRPESRPAAPAAPEPVRETGPNPVLGVEHTDPDWPAHDIAPRPVVDPGPPTAPMSPADLAQLNFQAPGPKTAPDQVYSAHGGQFARGAEPGSAPPDLHRSGTGRAAGPAPTGDTGPMADTASDHIRQPGTGPRPAGAGPARPPIPGRDAPVEPGRQAQRGAGREAVYDGGPGHDRRPPVRGNRPPGDAYDYELGYGSDTGSVRHERAATSAAPSDDLVEIDPAVPGRTGKPRRSRKGRAAAAVVVPVALAAAFAAFIASSDTGQYTGHQTPLDPGSSVGSSDQDDSGAPVRPVHHSRTPHHLRSSSADPHDTSATPVPGDPSSSHPSQPSQPSHHPTHKPTTQPPSSPPASPGSPSPTLSATP